MPITRMTYRQDAHEQADQAVAITIEVSHPTDVVPYMLRCPECDDHRLALIPQRRLDELPGFSRTPGQVVEQLCDSCDSFDVP